MEKGGYYRDGIYHNKDGIPAGNKRQMVLVLDDNLKPVLKKISEVNIRNYDEVPSDAEYVEGNYMEGIDTSDWTQQDFADLGMTGEVEWHFPNPQNRQVSDIKPKPEVVPAPILEKKTKPKQEKTVKDDDISRRPAVYTTIKPFYERFFANSECQRYFKLLHFILSYSFQAVSRNTVEDEEGRYLDIPIEKKDFDKWFGKQHTKRILKGLEVLKSKVDGFDYHDYKGIYIFITIRRSVIDALLNTHDDNSKFKLSYLMILKNESKLTNNQLYLLKQIQIATNHWKYFTIENMVDMNIWSKKHHHKKQKQMIIKALKKMEALGTIKIKGWTYNDRQIVIQFMKEPGSLIAVRQGKKK